jgi:hypothetical protein
VTFTGDTINNALYDHLKNNGLTNVVINETSAGIEDRFLELMNKTD